jgi:hypothetical protein
MYPTSKMLILFRKPNLGGTCTEENKPHVRQLNYGQEPSPQASPNVKSDAGFEMEITEKINLPLAIQQLDRTTSLVILPLAMDFHGDDAIREIKATRSRISMAQPFLQKTMNTFSSIVVGTATVRQVGTQHEQPDIEKKNWKRTWKCLTNTESSYSSMTMSSATASQYATSTISNKTPSCRTCSTTPAISTAEALA